jgi:hypothetical protein
VIKLKPNIQKKIIKINKINNINLKNNKYLKIKLTCLIKKLLNMTIIKY